MRLDTARVIRLVLTGASQRTLAMRMIKNTLQDPIKMKTLAKLFYAASFAILFVFLYLTLIEIKNTQKQMLPINKILEMEENLKQLVEKIEEDKLIHGSKSGLKYILQWTNPRNVPFVYMGVGQQGFIERKCKYVNCFVTSNRALLEDVTKFDVIAFAGTEVFSMDHESLPKQRSLHQKYTFTNIDSADNYPVCSSKFNNFFNWTWTYRLESETKWGYIIVRDAEHNIIGPKKYMHWMKLEDMDPVSDDLKVKLRNKTKTAAWFVSNCWSRSQREKFVKDLDKALSAYDLKVDIYGNCGQLKCEQVNEAVCNDMIERDYYFYLSFENSFAEDYVTEKLLYGLKHNAIPVVYGGANYTRFMPDGIYLNARELGPEELAKKMSFLINHPDEYEKYFRWKNHYTYHRRFESVETDDYCGFCSILNNKELVEKTSIYENFREWWDPPNRC